jgi:hypothetical protein
MIDELNDAFDRIYDDFDLSDFKAISLNDCKPCDDKVDKSYSLHIPGSGNTRECKPCSPPKRKSRTSENSSNDQKSQPAIRLTNSIIESDIALRVVIQDCGCVEGHCLRQLDGKENYRFDKGIELVKWCRKQVEPMSHLVKYKFIYAKFKESLRKDASADQSFQTRSGPVKRFTHHFRLGDESEGIPEIVVCRQAFMSAYGISHWLLDSISKHVKEGQSHDAPAFNDRTRNESSFAEMAKIFKSHGLKVSIEQIQSSMVHNSQESLQCFYWMHSYFNQFGDHIPNSNGQVISFI